MSSFYQVPKLIFDPVAESISGSVLLPADFSGGLRKQLEGHGINEIVSNSDEENLLDLGWWKQHKDNVDWVVCITQGMKEYTKYVTECGLQVAKKGVCILDRLTFLEPVKSREEFLMNSSLIEMKILSPRPSFRADQTHLKDVVTSAWFIFQKPGAAPVSTKISFALSWQRPGDLRL